MSFDVNKDIRKAVQDAKRGSDPVVGIYSNYPIWNPPHCGVCLF